MQLTQQEEKALAGEEGEALATAYRILVASGEATDAEYLSPVKWVHLSGVNYNTIGDSGESFLRQISQDAHVRVQTTLNPMGFDINSVSKFNLGDNFIQKQQSIRDSYERMGVIPTFSCIPYEIFDLPEKGTQVAFAESNAAIYANSVANLKTNKESAFTALASALTGKSPYSSLRTEEDAPSTPIHMDVSNPDELDFGMLGYFAGKMTKTESVSLSGIDMPDMRKCKSLCGGMGTSGTCAKFNISKDNPSNTIHFDKKESQNIHDELNTSDDGDIITLGSPQLGLPELSDLTSMLKNKSFTKPCMIFCPRTIQDKAESLGYVDKIQHAGAEIFYDCCICLTPLIDKAQIDGVITNSIKGAYYLNKSTGVKVNLKNLSSIIGDETK